MPAGGYLDITFTVDGVDTVQRKFVTFAASLSTLKPAWEEIGGDVRADFALNMIGEGWLFNKTATGRAAEWAPLAESTAKERVRLGYGGDHPILWRTGLLGESLATAGAAGNLTEIGDWEARFGTDIPYGRFHQLGTSRMPARPIVGLTRDRKAAVVRRLRDYIFEQIKKAGL